MSTIEVSYFEEKLGEWFSYLRSSDEIYEGYNFLSTTDSEGDRYSYAEYIYTLNETIVNTTARNLLSAGEKVAGLTTWFAEAGWNSQSFFVNCIDIFCAIPILMALGALFWGLSRGNSYSGWFKRLFERYYH